MNWKISEKFFEKRASIKKNFQEKEDYGVEGPGLQKKDFKRNKSAKSL